MRQLAGCTDYIVVHDTEPARAHLYPGLEDELASFRYRADFKVYSPYTTVVSETKELSWLARWFGYRMTDLDSEQIERSHKV